MCQTGRRGSLCALRWNGRRPDLAEELTHEGRFS
jgi:hypothetical protein